jgi:hypothetical protein
MQVMSQDLVCQLALLDTLVCPNSMFSVGITEAGDVQFLVSASVLLPTNPLPMCVGMGTGHVGSDQLWYARSVKVCIGSDAINVRAVLGSKKMTYKLAKRPMPSTIY